MTYKEVYLDNSSTTFMDPKVLDTYYETMKKYYGNPSSLHQLGVESEKKLKEAKSIVANTLKAKPQEILFTSGGTESNNIAIHGTINAFRNRGNKIITTKIEHPSVLEIFKYYESLGFEVIYLDVDESGVVNLEQLKTELNRETILVSIMVVNNEIGTEQPLWEIGQQIKANNPLCIFHVDAVQGYGKIDIDLLASNISLLSLSSHKLHGPKGVGALYVKDKLKIAPIMLGGGQQIGLRSGTENVPGFYAMAKACEKIFANNKQDTTKISKLRNYVWDKIKGSTKDALLLTPLDYSAPHILNTAFRGLKGEVLVHALESKGVFVSTGSACSSKQQGTSHVLKAIDVPKEYIEGAIRISFSRYNNEDDVCYAVEKIIEAVNELSLFMA
ncbi:cysteine desulfurase [Alkalicella caledoniensis]|uniref:Cysteine desulfurase n=1 Tax=Alkalicella caledoniensis TaxID=2731377 RepID=A0A7G9W4V0_ALKCA|nr:cysteine desulfurase family protein [Alkalicella caledoniensis]QNO13712.1 cysteine desulfurase [Alkalicella caledoniensis]